jgi:transposase
MPGTAAKIRISEKQQIILEELSRSRTVARGVVPRATIMLRGFQGWLNEAIAEEVQLNRQPVGVWRQRWRDTWESLCVWECREPQRLREAMLDVLADAPRPGAPPTFTAEQVAQIVALACESPKLSGRPISHWTVTELHDEVLKQNIVPSISRAQVGRFLQRAALQPHRKKMWLNTTEKDPETFQREVVNVCQTYLNAPRQAAVHGVHTVSVDEATALQALERNAPDQPVQPGQVAKQEFEYTRHGTTTLTASLDVVSGQIVTPTLEPTRTEPEFVQHIARTVSTDPTAEWVIVVDCLNTPMSESLVIWTAAPCGVLDELGKKRVRHPEIHGHTEGVLIRPPTSHPFRRPAETQLVAQSD